MADLSLTFLGSGTSQGVPMIGCDCAVCRSTDPRDHRTRASIYLETPECAWVVDTGPDFRTQCLREKVRRVDAVVYTHSHTDHIVGFDDLRAFCPPYGRPLPIYAAPPTMADIQRVFAFAFQGEAPIPGYVNPQPHLIEGPFDLGKTRLIPIRVEHGRAHVFGYLLERDGRRRVAYLSDCKRVAPEAVKQLAGVDLLVVDGLRHREHPTHMSVEEALALARLVQPGRTLLTHICHELGHAETEAGLPENVAIAYDGLRLEL